MTAKEERINTALNKAFKQSKRLEIKTKEIRWVLFSDHHRGRKDGADDFAICEKTYLAALDHYEKDGFTLCLMGDVEELWENHILQILGPYKAVMNKEKVFYDDKRLYRLWGNHDDDWRFAAQIEKHLGWLFPSIPVYEALVLDLKDEERSRELMLVHGHQGSLSSDRFAWISRIFVRLIWRNFQRLFKIPLSTPSNNVKLKSEHDQAMYRWADKEDKVLICGHTHQPVFMSYTHADKLRDEIEALEKDLKERHAELLEQELKEKRELLMTVVSAGGEPMKIQSPKPFYFNTGCCSFADGDITGIELADGEVRLVKWTGTSQERKVLGSRSLELFMD